MTKQERLIVSAYTGYLMVKPDDFNKYVNEVMGHPVYTHEMAEDSFWEELHMKVHDDFINLCKR